MKISCLLLLTIITFAGFAQQPGPAAIQTTNGLLQGVTEASGIHSYKGIPFAQPPVGDLRWKEPQEPKDWAGVRKADHFGPQAMQLPLFRDMQFRSAGNSEDCLYLNVWTAAKNGNEKLPVLVYFYGGGFQAGDGSEYRYDGESMAQKGIVTVTVNYRLGIFGFMAHPELTAASPHHASGNYGLMDQHAALVWVHKNIAAFGGDPDQVTIAGESAGSMSVSGQVASPLSKGLFIRAIAESGSLLGTATPRSLAVAEQEGVGFGTSLGAARLAELLAMPADTLLKRSANSHFGPDIDGYFLPESPQVIFAANKQMPVSLLAGWNSAENAYDAITGKEEPTITNYVAAVQKLYGSSAADVLKVYAPATDADVKQVATELASDRFIAFNTWKLVAMHSKGNNPVYRYYFTRKRPLFPNSKVKEQAGAVHSTEIEYALGNLATNKAFNWQADDRKISETMQQYFANFIKTGNPNGDGLVQWYQYSAAKPNVMAIDVNCTQKLSGTEPRYHMLDGLLPK